MTPDRWKSVRTFAAATALAVTLVACASAAPQVAKALPTWQDAWSDGCSIPTALQPFFPRSSAVRRACVRHDEKYYYGGTKEDRLRADLEWTIELLETGEVSAEAAEQMLAGVRAFGGPVGRQPYSWAFGGKVFAYTPSKIGGAR